MMDLINILRMVVVDVGMWSLRAKGRCNGHRANIEAKGRQR